MKNNLIYILIILITFQCQKSKQIKEEKAFVKQCIDSLYHTSTPAKSKAEIEDAKLVRAYLNHDEKNQNDSITYQKYKQYTNTQILDFLKERSSFYNESICIVTDSIHWKNMVFDIRYPQLPLAFYEKFIPHKEDYIEIYTSEINREWRAGDTIWIETGNKNNIQRKHEWIYGINELEDHIQLFLLGEGKYSYNMSLFTLSNPGLNYIDELNFYSAFVDAGTIEIKLGCMNKNNMELTVQDIHNSTTKSNFELADTIEIKYSIGQYGDIKKISEKLISSL